jgi:hypothetical protein
MGAVRKKVPQNAVIGHCNKLVDLVFNFGAVVFAGIEFRSLARRIRVSRNLAIDEQKWSFSRGL